MIIEKKDNFHLDEDVVPGALKPLMEEFQDFILLRNTYHAAIREVSTKLEILDDEFQVRYDYNPIHHMECRLKSPRSLFLKNWRGKGWRCEIASIYQITDMAGIRVICNYIDDVYAVASLLLKQERHQIDPAERLHKRTEGKRISQSSSGGGNSGLSVGWNRKMVPVEIQLRTIAMDTWASLEHELKYKRSGGITPEMEEELKDCANAYGGSRPEDGRDPQSALIQKYCGGCVKNRNRFFSMCARCVRI